ncbi:unnamed protein product [Caenorhabditis nigoni]
MDPPEVPKILTQLSSICVLEYLSWERRLYIVSQAPEFRKVEQSLPLNLDKFCISSAGIRLNECDYHLSPCSPELQKILEKPPYNITSFGRLSTNRNKKIHLASKKVVDKLIGDRLMICTRKLVLYDLSHWEQRERRDLKMYQLATDLKIRAEILEASGISFSYADLDLISNILGPKPLKELSLSLDNYEIFQHPIVRNSENLVLYSGRVDFDAQQINHRNIHMKNYHKITLIDQINEWIGNHNEIGMEFSGDIEDNFTNTEIMITKLMDSKMRESGGRRVNPDERFPNTLYSISMPHTNDPDTELQYSLLKIEEYRYPFQMHMKIQPAGTAIPERFDWEIRRRIRNFCDCLQYFCRHSRNELTQSNLYQRAVICLVMLDMILVNGVSICVLEYLSFEKRLYIVSQIPEIRKVEKSLPLHLDTLRITIDEITLDENKYYLRKGNSRNVPSLRNVEYVRFNEWDEKHQNELLPGDFCVGNSHGYNFNRMARTRNPPPHWTTELRMELKNSRWFKTLAYLPPVYDTSPIHVAFKKVVDDLIGSRHMIFTKKFKFRNLSYWDIEERNVGSKIYRLPVDLKIQAEILESHWFSFSYAELDWISNILGPNPLKEFSTRLDNFEILTHPIVQNSEKLVLWSGRLDFDHQRINHRHIHLKDYFRIFSYINTWIENHNEIGMEFSVDFKLENKSDWAVIAKEKWIKKKIFPNTLYSISMPRTDDPNMEVQMSLLRNESTEYPFQIHLKIQPSGTAIPEQSDPMDLELELWETQREMKNEDVNSYNSHHRLRQRLQIVCSQSRLFFANQYSHLKKIPWFCVLKWIIVIFVSGIVGFFLISWILAFFWGQKCVPFS